MMSDLANDQNQAREMNEPIRSEMAGAVSWLIPAPPKRVRSHISHQAPELIISSSPKNRPIHPIPHHPHQSNFPPSALKKPPTLSPTRHKTSSPPGSPNSIKSSSILRAWTKIFETAAHEMYTLCEADIESGSSSLSPPQTDCLDNDNRERDRVKAAIRRTKAAIYSVEFALLEFHALIRRSAVEARFEPTGTSIPEQHPQQRGTAEVEEKPTRASGLNTSTDNLDPKKQSCAWVVSTRAPLTQRKAFETVSDVLETLKEYPQYMQADGSEEVEQCTSPATVSPTPASTPTSTFFSQSSPTRRSASVRSENRDPTTSNVSSFLQEAQEKKKLSAAAKEYVPSAERVKECMSAPQVDADEVSSFGGTEDFGTEDADEDYVERVVLSARQAVWSEAEAWVDAAEKIALSLHVEDGSDDDNVLYGSDDGLSCDSLSMDSTLKIKPHEVNQESCLSIEEDSVTGSVSPLRGSASRMSWESPHHSRRSQFSNLSAHRKKGDGIGNMKANPLLRLHSRHDSNGTHTPLRGAEAKVVASTKDILWRRNVADLEQMRAERLMKAEGRRKAAYARAKEVQEKGKLKLDASAERAAAVVSREQKKTAAFAVNNNQKVSEVLFMKSLSAEGFQFGLQQRLKECEERILATTNRRQAYLQLRAEKAALRNKSRQQVATSTSTESDAHKVNANIPKAAPVREWKDCTIEDLRSRAKELGLQPRGTRRQLLSRIIDHSNQGEHGQDKTYKKKEMSALRLAHELDASKRWADLEKRIEKLSSFSAHDDSTGYTEPAEQAVRREIRTSDDQYYMSSSDEELVSIEETVKVTGGENSVENAMEEEMLVKERKMKKQQRRRKMKEQAKQKAKVARDAAASEVHASRWVSSDQDQLELMSLRSEFHELLEDISPFSQSELLMEGVSSGQSLKQLTVGVNDKVNELWYLLADESEHKTPKDHVQTVHKLLGELMVLKNMSRSQWTSNDQLKRRINEPVSLNKEEDAASQLFSSPFFVSPQKETVLDTMHVSPHVTPSQSCVPSSPIPSELSAHSAPSSLSSSPYSPHPSPQKHAQISPTTKPKQLFTECRHEAATFIEVMSPAENVIRCFLRSLQLSDIKSEKDSHWKSSILTTALVGISQWLDAHPESCRVFFTASDAVCLLKVVDMLNSEFVQWVLAYRSGRTKPSDILIPLLNIVEKAIQLDSPRCKQAQQVFWHYLCRSHFLQASSTIIQWYALGLSASQAPSNSGDICIYKVLRMIGGISEFLGADVFSLECLNDEKSENQRKHLNGVLWLLTENSKETSKDGDGDNLLRIVRQCAVSMKVKVTLVDSPDEDSVLLVTTSLYCLNRLHRLAPLIHNGEPTALVSLSPSMFHELWSLMRLIITMLGGGEVNTSALCDTRQCILPLLAEAIELVGFLASHVPSNMKQLRKKKNSARLTLKTEESSLLSELLLLPFSIFVSHQRFLYPSILSLAVGCSESCERGSAAVLALSGKLSGEHISCYLKEVKFATTPTYKILDTTVGKSRRQVDSLVGDTVSSRVNLEGNALGVQRRTAAVNALAVCAVANIRWSEWDSICNSLEEAPS